MDSADVSTPVPAPLGARGPGVPEPTTASLPTQRLSDAVAPQPSTAPQPYATAPVGATATPAAAPIRSSAVPGGDQCPSCGAHLAADQRYCLECGVRRGDPRLPFMDAVTVMDAVRAPRQAAPPPPKKKRSGVSPNAALIAGVGTLLLALGIGVLIGRSGTHTAASTAPAAPIVIHSGGEEATASTDAKTSTGGGAAASAKTKAQKKKALEEAEAHPAAEEILKPTAGVKLPPATVKPGDKCEPGAAGCKGGEFTGEFFGE